VSGEAERGAVRFGGRGASARATGAPCLGRRRTPAATGWSAPAMVGRGVREREAGCGRGAGLGRLRSWAQK
jgi:hypothetical protein